MEKYQILITANHEKGSVLIFKEIVSVNLMIKAEAFLDIIQRIMPTIDWKFDDGDININSEYCQYACYTEKEIGNWDEYLLASWSKLED